MLELTIAVFQADAADQDIETRLSHLARAAQEAAASGAQILVTPELYLSGYNIGDDITNRAIPSDGVIATRVSDIASKAGIAIIYGYPERTEKGIYNAAKVISPTGDLANHRKQALPGAFEQSAFIPGNKFTRFQYMGWEVALIICYEVEFPEIARAAAKDGAEILIVPTALKAEWSFVAEKIVPTRAFENGFFVVYANHAGTEGDFTYLGGSRIDGPDGTAHAVAGTDETLIFATINKEDILRARQKLPYLTDLPHLSA
ncbi:MAG: carbon-nitrogen hydrolase family protein [Pikeienuella sp.]